MISYCQCSQRSKTVSQITNCRRRSIPVAPKRCRDCWRQQDQGMQQHAATVFILQAGGAGAYREGRGSFAGPSKLAGGFAYLAPGATGFNLRDHQPSNLGFFRCSISVSSTATAPRSAGPWRCLPLLGFKPCLLLCGYFSRMLEQAWATCVV